MNRQPRVDLFRIRWTRLAVAHHRIQMALRQHRVAQSEADDQRAAALQQIAPRKGAHATTPVIAFDAR